MTTVIESKNLSIKSGKNYLLQNINWQVKQGEHWTVFGLNGSGKTTLLSVLAGFKPYTEGSLRVLGKEYTKDDIFTLRKKVGFVSSSFFGNYYDKEQALDIVLSGLFGTLGIGYHVSAQDVRLARKILTDLDLQEQMKVYLKRSNNIPTRVLGWKSPIQFRNELLAR